MKEKIEIISNNIRSYRIRAGLKQYEVANILGVSRTTYNDYEVNPKKLKIETLEKMATIFNCKIADFFIVSNVTESNNVI